jgi:hypothetical protein
MEYTIVKISTALGVNFYIKSEKFVLQSEITHLIRKKDFFFSTIKTNTLIKWKIFVCTFMLRVRTNTNNIVGMNTRLNLSQERNAPKKGIFPSPQFHHGISSKQILK